MFFKTSKYIITGAVCLASLGWSQVGNAAEGELLTANQIDAAVSSRIRNGLWENLATGPDGNLLGNDSAVVVQFYDENDKVNLDWALSTSVIPASSDSDHHRVWSYKLNASVPANADDKDNPLPTLDALADAYTIGFSLNFSLIPVNRDGYNAFRTNSEAWADAVNQIIAAINADKSSLSAVCQAELGRHIAANGVIDFGRIYGRLGTPEWDRQQELSGLSSWFAAVNFAVGYIQGIDPSMRTPDQNIMLPDLLQLQANPGSAVSVDSTLAEACVPEFYNAYLARAVDGTWTSNEWSKTFSVEIKSGTEEFEYLEPATFKSTDTIEQVHSATLAATLHKAGSYGGNTITGSYTYQKAYQTAAELTQCLVDADSREETCKNAIFAGPTEKNTSIFSIDLRARIENALLQHPIAIELKYSRDVENNINGVDVPVYLFSFAGEELNAGVRFGWESKSDEGKIGFFYGQKF